MGRGQRLREEVVAVLEAHNEGLRQAQIARELDEHPQAVARALVQLHERDVLLQEDDQGRISLATFEF